MKLFKYILILPAIVLLSNCSTDTFEELAVNPNQPTAAPASLIFNGTLNDMYEAPFALTHRWNQYYLCNYNYYGNTYQFFFEKREYFKFENEARIVTSLRYNDSKELLLLPEGIKINIDLDELIDEIYLAPKADQNFKSLIELKLSSLNLNKTVRFSDI